MSTSLLFVIVFSEESAKKKLRQNLSRKCKGWVIDLDPGKIGAEGWENSLVFKDQLRFHYSRGRIEDGHPHIVMIAEPTNWRLQRAKPNNVIL